MGSKLWQSLVYNNIQRREILIYFSANLFSNTLMHTNPYLTTPPQTVVPSIFSSTFLVLIFTTETHRHCQCHSSELSSWKFLQFGGIFIQNQNFERSSIQVSFRTKQPFSPVCLLCVRLNNIKILLNHFIVSVLVWRSQMDWSHVVSELRNWVQKEADKCKKCANMLACLLWMYGLGPGLIQESCTKKRTDEEVSKKTF